MKTNIKKLSAIVLTLVMVIGMMAIPTFATSVGTGTAFDVLPESQAQLNISTGNPGDVLDAYKIVNIEYNAADNTLKYEFTADFAAFVSANGGFGGLTPDNFYSKYPTDTTELEGLLTAYKAYVYAESFTAAVTPESATVQANGTATFDNMDMGQYIIICKSPKSEGARLVYQVVTAEVRPFVEDNTYMLYPEYDVAMKTSEVHIDKEITGGFSVDDVLKTVGNEGVLTYELKAPVPTFPNNATDKTFTMKDTLSDGLDFVSEENEVIVKANGTDLTDGYTVDITGKELTVTFEYDSIKGYTELTATYNAELNENAIVGGAGNANNVKLDFGTKTTTDAAFVYTYGLKIEKVDADDNAKGLSGATFEVYAGSFELDGLSGKTPLATITTNASGSAIYSGLAAGAYTLKETKAPAGYKLLTETVKITIGGTTITDGYFVETIENAKGQNLPSTGGIGTTIFTIVGLCLMLGAAVLLITKKRMANRG